MSEAFPHLHPLAHRYLPPEEVVAVSALVNAVQIVVQAVVVDTADSDILDMSDIVQHIELVVYRRFL